jgi:hypothetical protein
LRPGEPVEIGPATRKISMEALFGVQSNATADAVVPASDTYEPNSRSPGNILPGMIFYDAADGWKHTKLNNDYQGFVDLSGVLKTAQAVLVAMPRIDASFHGPELERNGQPLPDALDRRTVMFRFVLPVSAKKL